MAKAANGEWSLPKLFPPTPKDLAIQGKRMLRACGSSPAVGRWSLGYENKSWGGKRAPGKEMILPYIDEMLTEKAAEGLQAAW